MDAAPTDINEIVIKNFVEKLRPQEEHIRQQLDAGYNYDGKVAELYSIRPQWNDPSKIHHYPFAKISRIKTKQIWKLYWMRASGKWESYGPLPESSHLEQLLDEISKDPHGCFFG